MIEQKLLEDLLDKIAAVTREGFHEILAAYASAIESHVNDIEDRLRILEAAVKEVES
jgi:hypothetical protein